MCVSWRNVSHVHSTFHGLRNPIHTVHVQMIFFTPFHVVQTHSHQTFSGYRSHIFHQLLLLCLYSPIKCFYILGNCWLNGSLQRSPHKMFFNILCSVFNVAMVSWLTLLYVLRIKCFYILGNFDNMGYMVHP